jgi:hypothetical protein
MKKFLLFLIIISCIPKVYSQFDEYTIIDPEAFERISYLNLNILETFRDYNNLIYENDNKTIMNVNGITPSKFFVAPTSTGPVIVNPLQVDLLFHSRGFLIVANAVDLRLVLLKNSHLPLEYRLVYGWSYRSVIGAYRLHFGKKKNSVTIGALWRDQPYFETDSEGNKVFGYYQAKFKLNTSTRTEIAPFFHVSLFGIDIVTEYSPESNAISSADTEVTRSFGRRTGELVLGYGYSKFSDTTLAGFKYKKCLPFQWFSIGLEYYRNLTDRKVAYYQPTISVFLFRDRILKKIVKEIKRSDKRDFFLSLNFGYSYTNDIFDESIEGFLYGITLENFYVYKKWYAKILCNVTYNYHGSLYQMPMKDENQLNLLLQVTM